MRIEAAIEAAKAETGKPSLIAVRTVIGYGSPKAGTNKVHGEALGAADTAATKKYFGFPEDQSFYVPDDALKNWRKAVDRGPAAGSGVEEALRRVCEGVSRTGRASSSAHRRELAQDGMGEGDSQLSGGQASGHAQRGPGGDERDRRGGAGVVWRRGGSDCFDEDDLQDRARAFTSIRRDATSSSACASSACARR